MLFLAPELLQCVYLPHQHPHQSICHYLISIITSHPDPTRPISDISEPGKMAPLSRVNNPPDEPLRNDQATLYEHSRTGAVPLSRRWTQARIFAKAVRRALTVAFLHLSCTWFLYQAMKTRLFHPYLCEHEILACFVLSIPAWLATWICCDFWRCSRHPRVSKHRWSLLGLELAKPIILCEAFILKCEFSNYCTFDRSPNYTNPELLVREWTARLDGSSGRNGTEGMEWSR